MSKKKPQKSNPSRSGAARSGPGGKQRRTRLLALVLVAALALSVFAVAFASLDREATPEVLDTPDPAGDEQASAGYEDPQPTDAAPCPTDGEAPEPTATPYEAAPEVTIDTSAAYTATVATTCGEIVIELAPGASPTTVNHFVALARDGYYEGVPFHRVMNGFMIQGGDPTGTGHGNQGEFPGYTFPDELELAEQVVAEHGGYPRGTLAMANAGPDTNGSQFFIVQARPGYPLPPAYTVFGEVVEGMDVVDRIAQGPTKGDQAVDPVRITGITIDEQSA